MIVPPKTSPPALLRTRHLASKYFGMDGDMSSRMTSIPRYKFMFFANLIPDPQALAIYPELRKLGNPDTGGVSFKIKTIDKPKLELNTVELNQYNRKRYAYTKVEYQPFTIRMHDTVDNAPLRLWKDYFTYYFGDSRANKSSLMNETTVGPEFTDGTGWGLRPIAEDISFFAKIELYSIYGGYYTQLNYLNPKMTNIDWTQYDSSSSDPDEVSMTFKYEAIEYLADEKPITESVLDTLGFNVDSPAIEPKGLSTPVADEFLSRPSPRSSTSTYAEFKNTAEDQNVLSIDRSIVTDFGLNSGAYEQLMRPNMVTSATTTFTAAINANGFSASLSTSAYSNNPTITQNIMGIPNGALPRVTGQISGGATMGSLPANSSSLSVYGSFNFGSL